jgi:hypothetical protein
MSVPSYYCDQIMFTREIFSMDAKGAYTVVVGKPKK